MKKDNIFASPRKEVEDFRFDNRVAEVFPDMIQRSVPGYRTLISNIGVIAENFAQSSTNIYDLGCSLGAATLAIAHRVKTADINILAVDNSADMLNKAHSMITQEEFPSSIQFIERDIIDQQITNASVIVLNFTLQFITPEQRQSVINKIWNGLNPGGALILSEKLSHKNSDLMNLLHLQFKRDQGYSELEISQKRTSLENVMIIDSEDTHTARLTEAGFSHIERWYQCFNFSSYLAIK